MGSCKLFSLGWPCIAILWISSSWIARITSTATTLSQKQAFFYHWVWCLLWIFSHVACIILRLFPSISGLLRAFCFYHEMLNFIKCFFLHQVRWSCLFFPLCSADVVVTSVNFQMLNHPCIPGVGSTWSWCIILLIWHWILSAGAVLRSLHQCL